MSTRQHGKEVLRKSIEQRWSTASKDLLSILELLVDQADTRFESARRQILDIVNGNMRGLKEELDDYRIEHLKRESLVQRGQPPGGSREER